MVHGALPIVESGSLLHGEIQFKRGSIVKRLGIPDPALAIAAFAYIAAEPDKLSGLELLYSQRRKLLHRQIQI